MMEMLPVVDYCDAVCCNSMLARRRHPTSPSDSEPSKSLAPPKPKRLLKDSLQDDNDNMGGSSGGSILGPQSIFWESGGSKVWGLGVLSVRDHED